MGNMFIKENDDVLTRINAEEYSHMECEAFFDTLSAKLSRQPRESWEKYTSRKGESKQIMDSFVFGNLLNEEFDLLDIPNEYKDYEFGRHSEFEIKKSLKIALVTISLEDYLVKQLPTSENKNRACTEIAHSVGKINRSAIDYAFDYWNLREKLLNNSNVYLNESSDDDQIQVTRWLTATGKKGRTREVESLSEGCKLFYKNNDAENEAAYALDVISPNGITIGEINWKTECVGDGEYNTVYQPLLSKGLAFIDDISLEKVIPHNSPKGRPRKALVQVRMNIRIDKLPADDGLTMRAKTIFQSMRRIAAIDYNRKCDTIEGLAPDRLRELEELFSDNEISASKLVASFDMLRSKGSLSHIEETLSVEEWTELWNVYMAVYIFCELRSICKSNEKPPLIKDGKTRLYHRGRSFSYVLKKYDEQLISQAPNHLTECLRFSIYRN